AGQDATRLQAELDRLQRLYDATMAAANRLRALAPDDLPTLRGGQARLEYEDLYWVRLIGLESEAVENAMANFRKLLIAWEQDAEKPTARLNDALLELAKKCHEHLRSQQERIADLRRREIGSSPEPSPRHPDTRGAATAACVG
ncbi:MAG TPA: hypothetical protein VMF13_11940, partial [Luteitalea sp.]|nr:hypothetical protein [Luteitalea sp.]